MSRSAQKARFQVEFGFDPDGSHGWDDIAASRQDVLAILVEVAREYQRIQQQAKQVSSRHFVSWQSTISVNRLWETLDKNSRLYFRSLASLAMAFQKELALPDDLPRRDPIQFLAYPKLEEWGIKQALV